MAETTPRRSMRLPHTHTPKMSERKKGLFQMDLEASRETLTKHRRLSVVDSESDSDDCDLGIISTLDSSSGEETDQNNPKTPERMLWRKFLCYLLKGLIYYKSVLLAKPGHVSLGSSLFSFISKGK